MRTSRLTVILLAASLALTGIELDAEELFDTTLIDEVYEEHPELLEG